MFRQMVTCHILLCSSSDSSSGSMLHYFVVVPLSPGTVRMLLAPPHLSSHLSARCSSHQEIHELKDQIQDVESKYMQNLKEVKV